jgi:beta-barrel assembly-enhancing protease
MPIRLPDGRSGYDGSSAGYGRPRVRIPPRLIIAALVALAAIISYYSSSSVNPVTGKTQRIALTPQQEVALGLQSAPEMARQFGGVSRDARATALVKEIGAEIVASLPAEAPRYPFEYHLLADRQTINAFALPGGQMFITEALLGRLKTRGQLAGVLGHETGHVLARHSAQQMAKADLTQGLVGAATVAAGDARSGQVGQMVGRFILMKYGRDDELEADRLGVQFMARAGYDPRAMIGVMEILAEASGGGQQPDFMSTHPSSENRVAHLHMLIEQAFPNGVPAGMKP